MNRWEKRFNDHNIHDNIRAFQDLVNEPPAKRSSEQAIERRRLLKVLNRISDVLERLDPETVAVSALDNINSALSRSISSFRVYHNRDDLAHFESSNNELDSALTSLVQLLQFPSKSETRKYHQALEVTFDEFAKAAESKTAKLEEKVEELQRTRDAVNYEYEGLETQLERKLTEVRQLTDGWQSQFSEAQNSRTVSFDEERKELAQGFTNKLNGLIEEQNDKLESSNHEFENKIEEYREAAEKAHDEILSLSKLVAGDSVAASYIATSKDEKKQADFWRRGSIIFIILTFVWGVVTYIHFSLDLLKSEGNNGNPIFQMLRIFSVTAALIYGAVFTSRQSNIHRKNELSAKRFSLEIKAIDPFISSLPVEDQNQLKKNLSYHLFGQVESWDKKVGQSSIKRIIEKKNEE